jgi:D-hydroxyproline dehydrogenase subunit beta
VTAPAQYPHTGALPPAGTPAGAAALPAASVIPTSQHPAELQSAVKCSAVAADVVIVGGGIVGAACAYFASRAGLSVIVLERSAVAAGTTGAGEGNILVSDKLPGAELAMALRSVELWQQVAAELGPDSIELERKGGVVVAATGDSMAALQILSETQIRAGVRVELLDGGDLHDLEPHLAPGLDGGAFYPQDMQVQPMMAAARMAQQAAIRGADVRLGVAAVGLLTSSGRVTGVQTTDGAIACRWVVNAAGTWGGELSTLFGAEIPVLPRRGFILVTEPLAPLVRHKVYAADYVANVASSSGGLEMSSVIESTMAGTILIGASRERVGFDRTLSVPIVRRLARQAVDLFPILASVKVMRVYHGFRPYSPDHLPVVGPDDRLPGLLHACGHEGAGIGLAPATGELITEQITGVAPTLDATPFAPSRFGATQP